MADRYDKLNHNNLMASVGSMSRRWNDDIYVAPPQNLEDFFAVEGPDGMTIADEMGATIAQVTILNEAVRTTSYIEPEPLPEFTIEAIADQLDGPRPASAAAGLSKITAINVEAYGRLTDLRLVDWKKEATWGSHVVSITDLARGVSRVNAERLARASRVLEAVR